MSTRFQMCRSVDYWNGRFCLILNSGRTVQYKHNAQSLRLFGLHGDVNDAHRAGANRLQTTNKNNENMKETLRKQRKTEEEQTTVQEEAQHPFFFAFSWGPPEGSGPQAANRGTMAGVTWLNIGVRGPPGQNNMTPESLNATFWVGRNLWEPPCVNEKTPGEVQKSWILGGV